MQGRDAAVLLLRYRVIILALKHHESTVTQAKIVAYVLQVLEVFGTSKAHYAGYEHSTL